MGLHSWSARLASLWIAPFCWRFSSVQICVYHHSHAGHVSTFAALFQFCLAGRQKVAAVRTGPLQAGSFCSNHASSELPMTDLEVVQMVGNHLDWLPWDVTSGRVHFPSQV